MQFKELKSGYIVYVLNKTDMSVQKCKVTAVGIPRMDKINPTQMVIDITLDCNGKPATYCMRDSLDITYTGDLALTPNLDILLNEIESTKMQSEQALSSMEHHRELIGKAEKLLMDLNPTFKEKKENEERFSKLETAVNGITDQLTILIEKLK